MKKILMAGLIVVGIVGGIGASFTRLAAQQRAAGTGASEPAVSVDADDIGGVVRSAKGPEAGVWVIAETKSLPTGFRKIVVTDDRGRYVIPDLPHGTYSVWVRGYGLIDSKPVQTTPGKVLNLTAVLAPSPRAAAQYYPANYWYSLIQIPPKSAFPMVREGIQTQLDWVSRMKAAIQLIQIGDKATREFPIRMRSYGIGPSPVDGSVWLGTDEYPGKIVRVHPGANPPYTCLSEVYNSPLGLSNPKGVFVRARHGDSVGGIRGKRAFREFRPTKVQGHCGADRNGRSMRRRLDGLSSAWPEVQGCS